MPRAAQQGIRLCNFLWAENYQHVSFDKNLRKYLSTLTTHNIIYDTDHLLVHSVSQKKEARALYFQSDKPFSIEMNL